MPLSPLPLRVAIFDDEPAWSLAMRLSRRQGNDHIKSFCSEHDLSWNDVMMGRASASVAQMAGADEGAIERATPVRNAKGEAVLRGERIADWDFGTENIGVCPGCLREDLAVLPGPPEYRTHWRAWWKLRFARTCPFHRMRLVCERPDGGALDALAGDPRRAAGPGVDLAKAISEPVYDVHGEAYLLGRLGYGPRTSMPILDALPFKAAVRALDRFGAVATGGLRAYTSFDGQVDPHDALASGAAIFAEGREGVDRFLDRLVADNEPERGQWGPRQAYGQIYAWLERERYAGEDDLKPIRDIVAAHALRTIPVNPNEELFGEKIGERRLFALHHVWKETGIHTSRLRAVLQGLGLIGKAEANLPDWRIILDRAQVDLVRDLAREEVNQDEAFTLLGIGRGPRPSLLDSAFPAPAVRPDADGRFIYRRSDLDAWIARLQGEAPMVDAAPPDTADIVAVGRRSQRSAGEVVKALLDGRLRASARLRDAAPFMSIMVDVKEARTLFHGEIRRDAMMNVAEAVKALSSTHYVVVALIDGGHLPATKAPAVGSRRLRVDISRSDVAAFAERFISAKQAAAHVGLHSRTVREKLASQGVVPAIELPAFPATFFYLRAEVMRFPEGCFAAGRH
jgi:hypothetical protein